MTAAFPTFRALTTQQLTLAVAVGVLLLPAAFLLLQPKLRRQRRHRLAKPLPASWRAILARACPLYPRTPPALRAQVEPLARIFLDEVRFIGCNGLEVTLEMRLLIAYQACLLIVNTGLTGYDGLASVLVYPEEFLVEEPRLDDAGIATVDTRGLAGQTIETTRIVLSWPDVRGAGLDGDGHNVVLHEFAHHLDHALEGALSAPDAHRPGGWHAVLQREYAALCRAVEAGRHTLIDPYGAQTPAEFLAVATELFFELPQALRDEQRELYDALASIYRLDPAAWG